MKHTITILVQNKPGVLYRIADLFLRKKINIECLVVFESRKKGISRMAIGVYAEKNTVQKLVNQLYRIIEVVEVIKSEGEKAIFKEMDLVLKIRKNSNSRVIHS